MNWEGETIMFLQGKRVLLIMPEFYAYQTIIKNELEHRGAIVYYFNSNANFLINWITQKLYSFTNNECILRLFGHLFLNKLKSVPRCDYLIVICGHLFECGTIKYIIKNYLKSTGKSIYYAWDSICRLPNKGKIAYLFDKQYSFDLNDVSCSNNLSFLPLFYAPDVEKKNGEENMQQKYDLLCVTGYSKDRYNALKKLKEENRQYNVFFKIYLRKVRLEIKKVKEFAFIHNIDRSLISTKRFTLDEIRRLSMQSKAIVDITHQGQKGLSIRIIEAIGLERKIITTNSAVSSYDFYTPDNIYIMNESSDLPDAEWLNEEYRSLPEKVKKKYSIKAWIDTLFS